MSSHQRLALILVIAVMAKFASDVFLVNAQPKGETCRIGIETQDQFAVYTVEQNSLHLMFTIRLDESRTFEGLSLSPDHRYLAYEKESLTSSSGKEIRVYDISGSEPVEIAMISDERFIRGQHWSQDSSRLLTQDAHENQWISFHEIAAQKHISLSEHFDPPLEVWQVTWGPTNNIIGFYAYERPFPRTEYGINRVGALYYMNVDTFEYHPVSKPTEEADFYFGNFFILSEDMTAAYTAFDRVTNLSGLHIAYAGGNKEAFQEGRYLILDKFSDNQLLMLESSASDETANRFNLLIYYVDSQSLEQIASVQVDPDVAPFPLFSVSPNGRTISYVDMDGQVWLIDTEQNAIQQPDIIQNLETDFHSGDWSKDSNHLLIHSENKLYLYSIAKEDLSIISLPEAVRDDLVLHSYPHIMWLCHDP